MTASADTTFRELSAERRVEAVPLSHLSIELGHLYMEDFAAGRDRLRAQFERVGPWAAAARQSLSATLTGRRPRVSTCFLIDDYFTRFSSPAEVLPALMETARETGLEIDYIARESGCATAAGVPLAGMVAGRLCPVPSVGENGERPDVADIGWLSNGVRSPATDRLEALMKRDWEPPNEIGARNHSVFVDVELWSEPDGRRLWSCAFLAGVWQLLRLGMLRYDGASVARPKEWPESEPFPDDWDELPPLVQVRQGAAPFCAYRTFSVLPARFLQTEHAVRTILSQVMPEDAVLTQLEQRARGDGVAFPRDVTARIDYVFFNE